MQHLRVDEVINIFRSVACSRGFGKERYSPMDQEEWHHSKEWPRYDISNKGNIRNHETGKLMKTYISDRGYERVSLVKEGKQYTRNVGTLVGNEFVDGYSEGMVISHKRDKSQSEAENLEWKTISDIRSESNSLRKKIRCIETGEEYNSIKECSEVMNISRTCISRCINRRSFHTRDGFSFELTD